MPSLQKQIDETKKQVGELKAIAAVTLVITVALLALALGVLFKLFS